MKTNNPIFNGMSGRLGDYVLRGYSDRTILCRRPGRRRTPPTQKQKEQQERFRCASQYADMQMAIPEFRLEYEMAARTAGTTARLKAMRDYFRAPEIDTVDTLEYRGAAGDEIIIRATDDFRVEKVTVTIINTKGQEVEHGVADLLPDQVDVFVYTAQVANARIAGTRIRVTATDRPGNKATKEVVL